jgi:PAS domain S-box-containing protein
MNLSSNLFEDDIILIADDNEQTSLFIHSLLEDGGFKSITADSGQKTIQIVKSQKVDLVLLDIVMPDINGFTIANQIKGFANDDFLPVIMVTALTGQEDKITGLSCADDYITKPFSGDELIARIKSLLRIKHLHKELSTSKARFESLYENFPHYYVSINAKKEITNCNRFFRETFNITKEMVGGTSLFKFVVDEEHVVLEHFLNSLQSPESIKQRVFRLSDDKMGRQLHVNMKAVYIGDREGTGLWVVIAMEDVTLQLKMQEEQKIARMQLYRSARLASIGTLASGVAHEMNNPLTAILGFSSAILDRLKNNETMEYNELEQYLQIINMETLRCRDIVENLSRFAREGGDCLTAPVKLYDCLNDAIKLMHPKLVKSNINIKIAPGESTSVIADENKLEQVFINIITNCIDFCGDNSSITIKPGQPHDASRFYAIRISDNGPGIDPKFLPKVFDPFFTTKEVGRGTGMGLAICHRIMEEFNGSIDIISEKNKGTTVVLELLKNEE